MVVRWTTEFNTVMKLADQRARKTKIVYVERIKRFVDLTMAPLIDKEKKAQENGGVGHLEGKIKVVMAKEATERNGKENIFGADESGKMEEDQAEGGTRERERAQEVKKGMLAEARKRHLSLRRLATRKWRTGMVAGAKKKICLGG